jgi:hypothetical protein
MVGRIVLAAVSWRFSESVGVSSRSCWRLTLVRVQMSPLYSGWSWGSSCGRQSVDQFVWVSGLLLGPLTRLYLALLSSSDSYFILLSKAPSLTRKRVCSLQCNHPLVRLLTSNNHTLPSHLRLCSLFVTSYDSQGLRRKYSNPPSREVPPLGRGCLPYILYILTLWMAVFYSLPASRVWPNAPCWLARWLDCVVFAPQRAVDCLYGLQWRRLGRSK